MKQKFRRLVLGALIPASVLATACERSPVDLPGHQELGQVIILDRSTVPHTPLATWNHASGWDRSELMTVSHGTEANRTRVSLGAQMMTRGGEQITLSRDGEYSVHYGVAADPNNVVNMNVAAELFHGDHIHIYGYHEDRRTGSADIVFALWHVDHADGQTTPIRITFTD
jgi:hypothetical protein